MRFISLVSEREKSMCESKNTKYAKSFKSYRKLIWKPCPDDGMEQAKGTFIDTIYYNQKLALECNSGRMAKIVKDILKDEFSSKIEKSTLYELLIYVLTNRLCTMQSIKNVLSYKKERNILEIKEVKFKSGEVELKCLI